MIVSSLLFSLPFDTIDFISCLGMNDSSCTRTKRLSSGAARVCDASTLNTTDNGANIVISMIFLLFFFYYDSSDQGS